MKDQTLREALHEAASHDPGLGDPFSRFEAARRRSAAARGVVFVGLGILILLGFGLVFPNPLLRSGQGEVQVGGNLQPLPRTVKIYRDDIANFQIEFPSSWEFAGTEGASVAFFIPGSFDPPLFTEYIRDDGLLREVPNTFYVRVTPDLPGNDNRFLDRRDLQRYSRAGAIVTEGNVVNDETGQIRSDQVQVVFGPEPLEEFRDRIDYWCSGCRILEFRVVLQDQRSVPPLDVRIVARGTQEFNANGGAVRELLASLERIVRDGRLGE